MGTAMVDGGLTEMAPGVWRLRVPLPGHSIGHINSYLLDGDSGVLLIDVGWLSSGDRLYRLLADIDRQPGDVRGIVVTHGHADHCGLAATIARETGAWTAMHAADADGMTDRYFDLDGQVVQNDRWLALAGAPTDANRALADHLRWMAGGIEAFEPDRRLHDGDTITLGDFRLTTIHTPGHTPGHSCFAESHNRLLFTGDHVFSRINVGPSYRPGSTADPVGDYLASLDRLAALDVTTYLPGHLDEVIDPIGRIGQLREYHRSRADNVVASLRAGQETIWQIASARQRSLPWTQRPWPARLTALAEVHAHLLYLQRRGAVCSSGEHPARWAIAR